MSIVPRSSAASPQSSVDLSNPPPAVYRPDIDGLRAIAVLAVVAYHAGLSCPGGFVGVDVFFVISGYVITTLILKELREGRFTLAGFWERRARRILPANAVMVLTVLAAGWFLPSALDYANVGWSALAQSTMCANLYFWRQPGGYFDSGAFQPLLHTWSLGVEEQFYLFFPLGLLCLWRWFSGRLAGLRFWLWAAFVMSLVLAVACTTFLHKERSAFFLLPMRAWELLAGALLATSPVAWFSAHRCIREIVAWAGLAGIFLPIALYWRYTVFPGVAALPPCLGAVAIIWANTKAEYDGTGAGKMPTSAGRMLAWRPLVFIGLISYSLYLWHWPVLAFASYGLASDASLPASVVWPALAISFALALASWRWIETPFRKKRIIKSRKSVFKLVAAITAVLVISAASVGLLRGFPSRIGNDALAGKNNAILANGGGMPEVSPSDVIAGRTIRIGVDASRTQPKVLLWGDSHAEVCGAALDELCREQGISAEVVVRGDSPPLAVKVSSVPVSFDGPAWADAVEKHIQAMHIKDVLLAARWGAYERGKDNERRLEAALRDIILRLHAMGCRVWVLQDVPELSVVVPRALMADASPGWIWGRHTDWLQTRIQHEKQNAVIYRLANEGLPATFIDPASSMLEPDGVHYRASVDGVSLYYDYGHLTPRGARLVLLPLLRATLGKALAEERH